jgi:TP901 family phage tail tape measure protein
MDEDTNFTRIMDSARESAAKFGKTLTEVLDAYETFARQGYKEQDLINLGEAGLIASNVGEMSTAQAADYLTSAIIQFKLETKDAMKVIDAWNNVSNKNATTVEKLAAGMAKAGSTAHAFGLDMNQLNAIIGTVTAATKQSGEEVGNFVKSVLPRLLSQPAQDALKMLNVDFIDKKTGDMRNVIDIYGEVAEKLQHVSKIEKSIVLEGLAGKYHISRMAALLDNWELFEKILRDSQQSVGSAAKENDKYMQSLEARINLTKQEFQELAMVMGESFITEGFINALKGLRSFAEGIANITKTIGGLPLIMGSVTFAASAMSKTFRGLIVQGALLDKMFIAMGISAKGFGLAIRTAIASTGVGLIIAGISFGIEKLLQKMGEARQRTEELEQKNKVLTDSFKQNKNDIIQLTSEYEKYDKLIRNGDYKLEDLREFNRIRNQIAQLMPELILGEDQYGNKIIGTSEHVKARIKLLERQLELQERIEAQQKKEEVQKNYDVAKDQLKDLENQLNNILRSANYNGMLNLKSIDDVYKKIEDFQNKIAKGKNLDALEEDQYNFLLGIKEKYESLQLQVNNARSSYQNALMEMIRTNLALDQSTGRTIDSIINDFTLFVATSEESSDKINKVFDALLAKLQQNDKYKNLFNELGKAIELYKTKVEQGLSGEELEKYENRVLKIANKVKDVLLSLAKEKGFKDSSLQYLEQNFDASIQSVIGLSAATEKLGKTAGKSAEEIQAELQVVSDGTDVMDTMTDSVKSLDDQLKEAKGNFQALADIIIQLAKQGQYDQAMTIAMTDAYQALADEVAPLNELLEKLAEGKQISAAEAMELIQKEQELASAISIENGMVKVNAEAVARLRDAKISSYADMNKAVEQELLNEANAIVRKIYGYKQEVAAIHNLADAKRKLAEMESDMRGAFESGNIQIGAQIAREVNNFRSITENLEQMDKIAQIATDSLSQVGTSFENLSDSQDKANKETERAIYVADKYKQKLEEVEAALERIHAIQSKFPEYSKEYQNALRQEIELLKQKKKILQDQQKDLQNQIKSGKIQETGIVNIPSSSRASRVSGSSREATIWNFFASKGFSDSVIAGIMGNLKHESNLSTTIVNPKSGATGLAQWLGSRLKGLKRYAASLGKSWTDLQVQLDYLWKELNSTEKRTLNWLLRNQNASPATVATMFEKLFERAGGAGLRSRINFANQYYNRFAGSGGTVNTSDMSREAAEIQQAIDEAKSQVTQIQGEIANIDAEIARLETELVNAQIASFEHRKSNYDKAIENSENRLYRYDPSSELYRKELEKQKKALQGKSKENQKEIKFLQDLIKNGNLSAATIDQLKEKLHELGVEQEQIAQKTMELNKAIIDSQLSQYDEKKSQYDQFIENSNIRLGRLSEESQEYRKELERQKKAIENKNKVQQNEIKYLEYAIKHYKLTPEVIEEYKDKIHDLTVELNENKDKILELNKAIVDSQLGAYDQKKSQYDQFIDNSNIRLGRMSQESPEYRKELERQKKAIEEKNKVQKNEIEYLKYAISHYKLAPEVIEEYKNKIHDLTVQLNENKDKILELNKAIIDSQLGAYDKKESQYDQFIENSNIRLGRLTKGSEAYRKELERQRQALANKRKEQENELKYLKYAIEHYQLAPEVVEEYKQKIHDLGVELNNTADAQKKLGDAIVEDWIAQYEDQIDDINYRLDRSKTIISLYDDKDSEEYRKELDYQNSLLKERAKLIYDERQKILELMRTEDLSIEKKKELSEALEDLSVEYWNVYSQIKQIQDEFKQMIVNTLEQQRDKITEHLQQQIEETEKYYDSLIEAQEERLKLLDEEYEKEDRLLRLREIEDEIQKVKNDERYSYITAEGKEVLTYDKARVSELEKERDELLKQYQREDIKKAIQDEIDRLEKAKQDKINILNKEIEETRRRYDELINEEKGKWNELIAAAQNGTLTFDTIMNTWYGGSLSSLQQYGINVQQEISKIKAAFESLAQIQIPNPPSLPNPTTNQGNGSNNSSNQNSSSSSGSTKNVDLSNAEKVKSTNGHYYYKMTNTNGTTSWVIDTAVEEKLKEGYTLQQYHDGGIVGGAKTKIQSLADILFNKKLKPNETIVKSLIGELQIPPKNLPNIVHNIGSIVNSLIPKTPVVTTSGDTIHLHNVTIKADNPQQLFKELDLYIRMNRK